MEKITLLDVSLASERADGTPYVTKKGKPFKIAKIMWEGGTASKLIFNTSDEEKIKEWRVGDEVEVVLKQNGEYTNFDFPGKEDIRSDAIEKRVTKLEEAVLEINGKVIDLAKALKKHISDLES